MKRLSASLTAAAGGCSPAVALGPGRPAAVGSADQLAAAVPPLHRAPLVPAAATADAGGDGSAVQPQDQPWWMVLEDFVPVEVLVTEAMNPRYTAGTRAHTAQWLSSNLSGMDCWALHHQ